MWETARPPTTLSFLLSTRLKQERVREGGERERERGFQIRYANQIAEPKTGGESESNADLKPGNECGELECKARHTHCHKRPVDFDSVIMVVI